VKDFVAFQEVDWGITPPNAALHSRALLESFNLDLLRFRWDKERELCPELLEIRSKMIRLMRET
jgi:hypothetical protein